MCTFPHVDGYFFLTDDDFVFGASGGSRSEVEVRKGIKIEIDFFEGLQYVLLELIVFVIAQSKVVLEFSLVKLP
jgi:hypothetical protein